MNKIIGFAKRNIVFIIYFILTTLFFIKLVLDAPPVIYDASVYNKLATEFSSSDSNVFAFNFGKRTFVYPTFLSLLKSFSNIVKVNYLYVVYFSQFILFHLSNFLIYYLVKRKDPSIARIFILLSSINLITLSFINVLLTENLAIFFTTLLFCLFFNKKNYINLFLIGVTTGLLIFTRPSFVSLVFVLVPLLIYELFPKRLYLLVYFFIGIGLISVVAFVNTYNTTGKIGFFNDRTKNIYLFQVKLGAYYLKYETNINLNDGRPQAIYNNNYQKKYEKISCNSSLSCLINYLINEPKNYITTFLIHGFNLLDRAYVDTYIQNIRSRDIWLQVFNYFVLSSNIIYLFIFRNIKNYKYILYSYLFIIGTLILYLPAAVEPRFSSSVFPMLLLITAAYVNELVKKFRMQFTILNGIFILIFFIISQLIDLQVTLAGIPLYK